MVPPRRPLTSTLSPAKPGDRGQDMSPSLANAKLGEAARYEPLTLKRKAWRGSTLYRDAVWVAVFRPPGP